MVEHATAGLVGSFLCLPSLERCFVCFLGVRVPFVFASFLNRWEAVREAEGSLDHHCGDSLE